MTWWFCSVIFVTDNRGRAASHEERRITLSVEANTEGQARQRAGMEVATLCQPDTVQVRSSWALELTGEPIPKLQR